MNIMQLYNSLESIGGLSNGIMICINGHRALVQKSFTFTAFHIILFLLTAYQRCDVIQCFIAAFQQLVAAVFLPLDEAVASRAVFVIVSGSSVPILRLWKTLSSI